MVMLRTLPVSLLAVVASAACASRAPQPVAPRTAAPPVAAARAQAAAQPEPQPHAAPTFIHDDFAAARALSAKQDVPLVVEVEAPW
jgi:hypothetical protein